MSDDGSGPVAEAAGGLGAFIDASPSPFHAVAQAAAVLEEAGLRRLDPARPWSDTAVPGPAAGAGYVVRDGALVAWRVHGSAASDPAAPFHLVGAHTDSPNLRVKPVPDTGRAGWQQLGVEVYGGVLLNSWLDRDLGLSGRVAVRTPSGDRPELRLMRVDEPLARVPQLAIHLDRNANDGLKLDRQQHLAPVWALGDAEPDRFRRFLADRLDVGPEVVVAWDLMFHDLTPSRLLGADHDLLAAPRIDNLASCHAAVEALARPGEPDAHHVAVISLFDHEEVGSVSASGAAGTLLAQVLERIVLARDGRREDLLRALADSLCISADGAHATHPSHAERHEPNHHIRVNAGPVLKVNANQRYATDAGTAGRFLALCDAAGVPAQTFVSRTDLPCGSTIGPSTAAQLGMRTVDAGIPMLSMHSARELCGTADPPMFARVLARFLGG